MPMMSRKLYRVYLTFSGLLKLSTSDQGLVRVETTSYTRSPPLGTSYSVFLPILMACVVYATHFVYVNRFISREKKFTSRATLDFRVFQLVLDFRLNSTFCLNAHCRNVIIDRYAFVICINRKSRFRIICSNVNQCKPQYFDSLIVSSLLCLSFLDLFTFRHK